MQNIGLELKQHRETNGYSQSQLAKETGISQQKISYYESGKHSPPIEDCITLANFYGITLDELIGRGDFNTYKTNITYNHSTHNGNNNF